MNGHANAFCKILIVAVLSVTGANALNAPYLTSATPTNGHSISLTWRNNDFAATQVLILRKTVSTAWVLKDSVAGTVTSYTDSSLQPLTGYSFALLVAGAGVVSDTSNVLTATTLKAAEIFAIPGITVFWAEGRKFIFIYFFDSSNTEKGFRLFRKSLTDPWTAIDSVITKSPDSNSWKSFADSSIVDNKWYSYKVQVYNDSQTAFSPETTVYNYARPKQTKSYAITKKGSVPAKPISWVERIGDSLYFPEVAAPGDTEITLVDVSNSMSPQFSAYISPKNIPAWLKGSVVEARVKIVSDGIFTHRNGFYIVSRNATIYKYDSASLSVRDSVKSITGLGLIGWLNDSCCLFSTEAVTYYPNFTVAQTIRFRSHGIDTFQRSIKWENNYSGLSFGYLVRWGCFNNIAVFISCYIPEYNRPNIGSYIMYDFSTGFDMPVTYSEKVPDSLFSGKPSPVIDTSVVFTTSGSAIYAFNIADAYSGPSASYLGKFDDINFKSGNVKEIKVDTIKKTIYIIGDAGISLYSYSIGPVGVRTPSISRNSPLKRIAVSQNTRGVSFSIIGAKMQSLQVLNAKGQIIRSVNIPAGETFVWNRQDNAGRAVPVGFYIYKIGTLKDGVIAGSLVLTR